MCCYQPRPNKPRALRHVSTVPAVAVAVHKNDVSGPLMAIHHRFKLNGAKLVVQKPASIFVVALATVVRLFVIRTSALRQGSIILTKVKKGICNRGVIGERPYHLPRVCPFCYLGWYHNVGLCLTTLRPTPHVRNAQAVLLAINTQTVISSLLSRSLVPSPRTTRTL